MSRPQAHGRAHGPGSDIAPSGDAPASVPIRGAAFTIPASPTERPQLRGSECPDCHARFAGHRAICLGCGRRGLNECLLSPFGAVWTFTIVHQQPPGSIIEPPYAIVQVRLADGPTVASVLTDTPISRVRVGMSVELTLMDTGREDDGHPVVAFAFRAREEAA